MAFGMSIMHTVIVLSLLLNGLSQPAPQPNCSPQPNLQTCHWYRSMACCTPEQDADIGKLIHNITTYNAKNFFDSLMRSACDYRMSLYACKPCAPQATLPTCINLCKSIAFRCGTDYADNLQIAFNYTMDLTLQDSCDGCVTANHCADKNCWNFGVLMKASLLTLILPLLLLL